VNICKREDRGMLGRKNYTKEEINTGRAMVEADLRAYRILLKFPITPFSGNDKQGVELPSCCRVLGP
jgi:hypothetical protein